MTLCLYMPASPHVARCAEGHLRDKIAGVRIVDELKGEFR
jgi:hypothetical protein